MKFIQDFNKTALIYEDKEISYKEVLQNVSAYSNLMDIEKGDRIAIFSENRPEYNYTFYATWNKKGINVPIDFMSTADEVAYIIDDCRPKYIFTSQNVSEVLNSAISKIEYKPQVYLFENLKEIPKAERSIEFVDQEDLNEVAVIIYTSGTTGNPKGVMLSYDNVLANIQCVNGQGIITLTDTTVAILPNHHVLPLQGSIMLPTFVGAKVVILKQISSEEILKAFQKYKATYMIGVPRLYNLFHNGIVSKINQNKVAKLLLKVSRSINSYKFGRKVFKKVQDNFGGHLQYCICGGAKLDPEVNRDFKAMGFEILEGYGMTETAPIITNSPPGKVKIGSVGLPYGDVKVKIVDDEILASGRIVMKGYYNKPEETAEILKDGWIHTGDTGYIDKDGYLYITGRKKEIIILPNGKNLNPEEIEKKVMSINPIVKEIGVFQKDDQLFAVIFPDFNRVQQEKIVNINETIKWEVIDKYNLSAAPYKRIFNFTVVHNELPKTRLGKIKRFTLSELVNKEKKEIQSAEIPQFQEYKFLEEYLKNVTKKDIFPDEHVELDLGLDSLDKVELQAQIERTFGFSMNNEDLSIHSTVRKLADFIKEKKTKIENEVMHWGKVLKEDVNFDVKSSTYMLKFLKFVTKPFFKTYIRIDAEGIENIPDQPVIIAPNHQSFMDGLLIANVLENKLLNKTYFFAKEKNIKSKISQFFAKNSNILVLNLNKDLKQTLQKIAAVIKKGNNMVIFPEGARSRDGKVMDFKKSFAILSKELNVPVIPVVIKGAYEKFSIGSKFPKPGKIQLKFLKPIYPENFDYDEITSLAQKQIESN